MAQSIVKELWGRLGKSGRGGGTASGVPDINLIPKEYLPRPILTKERGLVLLVVLELLMAVVLFRSYGEDTLAAIQRLTGKGDTVTVSPQMARYEKLNKDIAVLRAKVIRVDAARAQLSATSPDWPQLLDIIVNQGPSSVVVSSLREGTAEVTLTGTAADTEDVRLYREILLEVLSVDKVTVLSIAREPGGRASFGFQLTFKKVS